MAKKDPYETLGISPDVSEREIKAAYHMLAQKFHPDFYENSSLSSVAEQKMKEINLAYERILHIRAGKEFYIPPKPKPKYDVHTTVWSKKEKKPKKNDGAYRKHDVDNSATYTSRTYKKANKSAYYKNPQEAEQKSEAKARIEFEGRDELFVDINHAILSKNFLRADEQLSRISTQNRDAEWYHLRSVVLNERGWLEEALSHAKTACSMDTNNVEYRDIFLEMTRKRVKIGKKIKKLFTEDFKELTPILIVFSVVACNVGATALFGSGCCFDFSGGA